MRIKELDSLRGLSAILVFLFHFKYFLYGYLGVHIFFMLSGFVIYMTISTRTSASTYIINRISRLYPCYWVCVTLSSIAVFILSGKLSIIQFLANLTMFQGLIGIKHISGVYWTLTEEWIFYFFILIFLLLKLINRTNIWCSLVLILSFLGLFFVKNASYIHHVKYFPLFISGIYFYNIYSKSEKPYIDIFFISISFLLLCLYSYEFRDFSMVHYSRYYVTEILIIFSLYIVFFLLSFGYLNFLGKIKFLNLFGRISYPFYLLHESLGIFIKYLMNSLNIMNVIVQDITIFILIFFLSYIVHFKIEKLYNGLLKVELVKLKSLGKKLYTS